jgi:hypothetical protein
MRSLGLVFVAACSGGDEPQVTATMALDLTDVSGEDPSPLDPLANQRIDLTIALDDVGVVRDENGTCRRLVLFVPEAGRSARGATADLVQRELLDRLVGWDVVLELCDDPALSTVVVESSINELNTIFGCATVPDAAHVRDPEGFPALTSFRGTGCTATILDVVNTRVFAASDFAILIFTNPAVVP